MSVKWHWRRGLVAVCVLILPCYHICEGLSHDQGVSWILACPTVCLKSTALNGLWNKWGAEMFFRRIGVDKADLPKEQLGNKFHCSVLWLL